MLIRKLVRFNQKKKKKKKKEKKYEIEVLNGIGVFIGANNWFFVWGGEGGWPFLPSPILLV